MASNELSRRNFLKTLLAGAATVAGLRIVKQASASGPEGYWRWYLERAKGGNDPNPTYTAMLYAQLGEKDQAFASLEKAYEQHDGLLYLLKVSSRWDPLRDDPRYHDLLRRMNFPE